MEVRQEILTEATAMPLSDIALSVQSFVKAYAKFSSNEEAARLCCSIARELREERSSRRKHSSNFELMNQKITPLLDRAGLTLVQIRMADKSPPLIAVRQEVYYVLKASRLFTDHALEEFLHHSRSAINHGAYKYATENNLPANWPIEKRFLK